MLYNLEKLRRLARAHKTLAGLMHWEQLFEYALQNTALEVVQFAPETPTHRVLVLAPHPDDDIFGCGGTLARHIQHGDTVHVLFLTDGSRGTASGRRDKSLIATREQEAEAALAVLGVESHQFWRFPDGQFAINKTTLGLFKGVLDSHAPDIIYVPWFGDDHPDHYQVVPLLLQTLLEARQKSALLVRQYEVWTSLVPNRIVGIGEVIKEKIQAMEAHQSQLTSRNYRDGILGLNAYRGALAGLEEPAEAFFELPAERFIHFCQKLIQLQ